MLFDGIRSRLCLFQKAQAQEFDALKSGDELERGRGFPFPHHFEDLIIGLLEMKSQNCVCIPGMADRNDSCLGPYSHWELYLQFISGEDS